VGSVAVGDYEYITTGTTISIGGIEVVVNSYSLPLPSRVSSGEVERKLGAVFHKR
jgi:hypothetical protein